MGFCWIYFTVSSQEIWLWAHIAVVQQRNLIVCSRNRFILFQRENLPCLGCLGGYCSVAKLCPTLCNPMDYSTPDFPVLHLQSLLQFMSIELVMLSNHLILYVPLLLLPSIFPSIIVISNELALHIRWPKYWSFCFIISPSNEYSGLISFSIDWFDLAVQGTLKGLFQHHNWKASVLGA